MPKTSLFVPYTEDYKNKCFIVWYLSGRPIKLTAIHNILPKDENGRVPSTQMIGLWKAELGWDLRADELDARAMEKVDDSLVLQKAEMFKRQAEHGKMLQDKGADFLKEKGIDSSASAITAVIKGAELERVSRGASEFLRKMSKMSDEELKAELMRLSQRADNKIIDAEEIENADE